MKKFKTIDREISWLSFNERVLQEAADDRIPLIERLRFLGIFSNNLDEFFRVRVATLRRLADIQKVEPAVLDYDAVKVLSKINKIYQGQQNRFDDIHQELIRKLEKENIFLINEKQLSDAQQLFLTRYFRDHVRPAIFPVMIKNLKRSSFIRDRAIYLAIHLMKADQSRKDDFALVKVPSSVLGRFVILPDQGERKSVILLDDVIRFKVSEIFPIFDFDDFRAYTIKITRDAELDIDNDVSKSYLERLADSLKQRKKGRPVRFVYDQEMPDVLLQTICHRLKISGKDNMVPGARYHNFKDFMTFPNLGGPHLEYPPMQPLPHPALEGTRSILDVLRRQDVMLHFPYQSFRYIIDLLREASIDPRVKSIKMTIYRAARNSKVINALVSAARNGKNVTVFLELQARFDEEANIFWAEKMQEEGVTIIQGIPGVKVHSKLMLIKRREGNQTVSYANIGTGNFNEETARLYGDDSLLTSNPQIAREVEKVFGLVEKTVFSPVSFRHLIVSPFRTRRFFLRMIGNEIKQAADGKPASLLLKMNSLVDTEIVRKLYQASQAGVKCRLIVRGICVLVPGVAGLSENIEVISIVDRFLEHSRVFVFHNGGKRRIFISSADFMTRNLDHRIEVGCPVLDPALQEELMSMLEIQWNDNVKARVIDKNMKNHYRESGDRKQLRSQTAIYDYFKQQLPDLT
ncbi:MAG: polyphosphate kinase 1 [Bacteroidales bacterium]